MPVIEYPAGLPCPQTSSITPEERRFLSEGERGPRDERTIELDERAIQPVTFVLSSEQAALYKEWRRDTLFDGGAWFAAPVNWPALEGRVIKVRRFIGEAQWNYLGMGFWRVTETCEVRGETLLPLDAGTIYFEDEFDGPAGQLAGHIPNVAPSGFAWSTFGFGGLLLSGSGYTVRDAESSPVNPSNTGWEPMPLGECFYVELDAYAVNANSESSPKFSFKIRDTSDDGDSEIEIGLRSAGLEGETFGRIDFSISLASFGGSFESEGIPTDGRHVVRMVVSPSVSYLTVDGEFLAAGAGHAGQITHMDAAFLDADAGGGGDDPPRAYRVTVMPNQTAPVGSSAHVQYDPSEMEFTYGTYFDVSFEYILPLADVVLTQHGAAVQLFREDSGAWLTDAASAVGDASGIIVAGPTAFYAKRFVIGAISPAQKIIVGLWCEGGPPIDVDAAWGGNQAMTCAYDSTGLATEYASSETVGPGLLPGDLVDFVYADTGTPQVYVFVNYDFVTTLNPFNNNFRPLISVAPL